MTTLKTGILWVTECLFISLALATTINLTYYTSSQPDTCNGTNNTASIDIISQHCVGLFFFPLLWNLALLMLFLLQHSGMASRTWKEALNSVGLLSMERPIYLFATCVALLVYFYYSVPLLAPHLWCIETNTRLLRWTFFFLLHLFLWFVIYSAAYCLDISELVGLTALKGISSDAAPPNQGSRERRRLLHRMRHAGVSSFVLILWIHPVMSVERFLTALVFTLYAVYGHKVREEDYEYVKGQSENDWRDILSVRYEPRQRFQQQ